MSGAAAWTTAMRTGVWGEAWRIADAALAARDPRTRDDPALPYHLRWVWEGTPPDGRHVLLRCYHGLGDTVQFLRFLPALARRAASVTVEIQPALAPIAARHYPACRFHPFDEAAPLAEAGAVAAEIMELGHMLRATPDEAAACVPYLAAPPAPSIPPGAFACCWQAGGWDPRRDIPAPLFFGAIAAARRPLVSVQRGPAAGEARRGFVNPCDTRTEVETTAALLAAASALVSVDTFAAHLAGALGRPLFVLLPAEPDWRWPAPGTRSAWYPQAATFSQTEEGDWTAPLAALAERLRSANAAPAGDGSLRATAEVTNT